MRSGELSTKLAVFGILGIWGSIRPCAATLHRHYRRQVPQEWAHAAEVLLTDEMLKLDNPSEIVHTIFSLLGDKAATKGLGKVSTKNLDCFQKIIANQAFKNAKKAKNQKGQEAAIIFGSVERNSGAVGRATVACKSTKVDSPEIQRLIQHQDAAGGKTATDNNKLSAKLAALSLQEIGSDPFLALRTGTFKAGDPKKPNNGAGFSCDDDKDKEGCIYKNNRLVEDVTKAEIEEFLKKEGKPPTTNSSKDTEKTNPTKRI